MDITDRINQSQALAAAAVTAASAGPAQPVEEPLWRGECVAMVSCIRPKASVAPNSNSISITNSSPGATADAKANPAFAVTQPGGNGASNLTGAFQPSGEATLQLPKLKRSTLQVPLAKASTTRLPRVKSILKGAKGTTRNRSPGSLGVEYGTASEKKVRIDAESPRNSSLRRAMRRIRLRSRSPHRDEDRGGQSSPKSKSMAKSKSTSRVNAPPPPRTPPEPKGIGRMRRFVFPVKWEQRRLEGMVMTQHNPVFASEKRIQGSLINDGLKVLIDKVFQVRFILQRGLKVPLNTKRLR
jgi:hypothetical protein